MPGQHYAPNLHFWNRMSTVHVHIPEFLADYSTRAATLWRRLIGGDDVYEIELDTGTYRFEPHRAGILTPDERQELRTELRPILSETEGLYQQIDEDAPTLFDAAREMHLIEGVHALCLMSGAGPDWLLYRYTH